MPRSRFAFERAPRRGPPLAGLAVGVRRGREVLRHDSRVLGQVAALAGSPGGVQHRGQALPAALILGGGRVTDVTSCVYKYVSRVFLPVGVAAGRLATGPKRSKSPGWLPGRPSWT